MKLSTKTIASFFVILPIAILSFSLHAQEENLVENGSFENLEGKLKALGCIDNAKPWMSPTGARADIFTPSKVLDINTPENKYCKEDATPTYNGMNRDGQTISFGGYSNPFVIDAKTF